MKKLRKGFTLIELLVVIAIIGILATTVAPKLREQLAKAKDSKAIALLGAARTAAGVVLVDKMVSSDGGAVQDITLEEITDKLDESSAALIGETNGEIVIGGGRVTSSAALVYGNYVYLTSDDGKSVIGPTNDIITSGDSIELKLVYSDDSAPSNSPGIEDRAVSTEGKEWITY